MDAGVSGARKAASCVVLLALTLERLAYYGLVSTFFLFLNKGPWSPEEAWDSLDALNAVFILLGCSYLSALLGGYISDAWLGRFATIVSGLVLYILGFVLLILISVDRLPRAICADVTYLPSNGTPHAPCKPAVYSAIVVVGVAVGMVKANIGPFGAEQLGPARPGLSRAYFNAYYWCVNLGSLLGVGGLAWLEQDGPGFQYGYGVAAGCLMLALLLLLACSSLLHRAPPAGSSPLLNMLRITADATKHRLRALCRRDAHDADDAALYVRPTFLDYAKVRHGGRFHESAVEDVRAVGSMIRLFACLLPYWLVYFQMQTSFQAQALHMRFTVAVPGGNASVAASGDSFYRLEAHSTEFSVPAAWLTLFNQILLIVALPILTKFLYPCMEKAGMRQSVLTRIGLGMAVSCVAVFTAGGLETYRTMLWRTDNSTHIVQTVGNSTYNGVDLSVFWQVPQYVLLAIAEALASIAGLEYAYSEAPRTCQSLVMGLFFAMEGVGSFLGIALLQILAPFWLSDMTDYANINDNHLDYYLYFLGIIQMVMLVVYTVTVYLSRFTLHLVNLPCDDGIGGSHYHSRGRHASSDPYADGNTLLASEPPPAELTFDSQVSDDDNSLDRNRTFDERLRQDLLEATLYPSPSYGLPTPPLPRKTPPPLPCPTPPPLEQVEAGSWSAEDEALIAAVERDARLSVDDDDSGAGALTTGGDAITTSDTKNTSDARRTSDASHAKRTSATRRDKRKKKSTKKI